VWEASNLDDVHPGDQVFITGARPTGYGGAGNVPADRMRMGRVIEIDTARSMILLDSGASVGITPKTRMRLNGKDGVTQIVPGDEIIVVIGELPGRQAARSAGAPRGLDRDGQGDSESPSAMGREAMVERWDTVQADEVHIIRHSQAP
jgi:hypothetical protein